VIDPTTQGDERNSWSVAERYIAGRLDRLETQLEDHGDKLYHINGEVSGLRVRASIFGVFGGVIAAFFSLMGMGGVKH
jgi:hypothetical protein